MDIKISRRNCLLTLGSAWIAPVWAQSAPSKTLRPLQVVASFSILADLVREVGGEDVQVRSIVGPDADAHVFEPAPTHLKMLQEADLVFINGLRFEGWMERLLQSLQPEVKINARRKVVVTSEFVTPRQMAGQPDPHAWQDLMNGKLYVQSISAALSNALPQKATVIQARAQKYSAKLADLHEQMLKEFNQLPALQRRVFTSHDAFGYLAQRYGLEVISPQSWNTQAQPSAAQVARVIRQIKQSKAKAVFLENISNPRLMKRIAEESGAVIGGTLYSDALSAAGGAADTYLKMMNHNLGTLLKAFQAAS
jgi:zinc/manganese transport system substrate-binding protein